MDIEKIKKVFSKEKIGTSDEFEMFRIYAIMKATQYIRNSETGWKYAHAAWKNSKYNYFRSYLGSFPEEDKKGNYEWKFNALYEALAPEDLYEFIKSVTPNIIKGNIDAFLLAMEQENFCDIGEKLIYLCTMTEIYRKDGNVGDIQSYLATHYTDDPMLAPSTFDRLWNIAYPPEEYPFKKVDTVIDGHIDTALKAFKKHEFPYEFYIQLFSYSKKSWNKRKDIFNPYRYWSKMMGREYVYSEFPDVEETFNTAVRALRDIKPTDYFRALQINESNNDSGLENGIAFEKFSRLTEQKGNALIINPNPDFILGWDREHNDIKTTVSVESADIAKAYKVQFPHIDFCSFDAICGSYGCALITARDMKIEETTKLLATIGSKASELMVLIPNKFFDNLNSPFKMIIYDYYAVYSISIFSSKTANSVPHEKVLLELSIEPTASVKMSRFELIGKKRLRRVGKTAYVDADMLKNSSRTIGTLYRESLNPSSGQKREQPMCYQFTPEIPIWYSICKVKSGSYKAKVYAYEPPTAEQKRHNTLPRGKKVGEVTFCSKYESKLIEKVKTQAPYCKDIHDSISVPTIDAYRRDAISLRTIWYCHIDQLSSKRWYDKTVSQTLMESDLGLIKPRKTAKKNYQDAMERTFGSESKTAQTELWNQLQGILTWAVDNKFCDFNPIEEFVEQTLERDQTFREVRNGLTKKTFTEKEEMDMTDFVKKNLSQSGVLLGGVIRFYTGLMTSYVCALTWGDFKKITNTNAYHIWIHRLVDRNGCLMAIESKNLYRWIPALAVLAELLEKQKENTKTIFKLTDKDIEDMPIVPGDENDPKVFSTPKKLNEACQKIIDAAKIKKSVINVPYGDEERETDLSDYQGDIFRSNFHYRATGTCGLTDAEVRYILGLAMPDTFSKYYCDFSNDSVQLKMCEKLDRWETLHHYRKLIFDLEYHVVHTYITYKLQKKKALTPADSFFRQTQLSSPEEADDFFRRLEFDGKRFFLRPNYTKQLMNLPSFPA